MSNLQKWIDPNGLIVLGATLALLGVVALAAAVSLPWHDSQPMWPLTGWLLAPGLGFSCLGAGLVAIGIHHRPKKSDLSVPFVVGMEMLAFGSAINWVSYLCFHDAIRRFFPASMLGGAVIVGGVGLLCRVAWRKWQ